jgi:hypothetical protein
MKKTLTLLAGLTIAQLGFAEPAIYRDGTLLIDEGAAVSAGGQTAYYTNVYLRWNANKFQLLSVDPVSSVGRSLLAQTGVYQNGAITIGNGAMITGDGAGFYYKDVVLGAAAGGGFTVTSANNRPLVDVSSVQVLNVDTVNYPQTATIQVTGMKSRPCVDLEEAAYSRTDTGSVVTVLLAETAMAGSTCAAAPTAFTANVSFKICNCKPGNYTVNVNGDAQAPFVVPAPAN